MPNTESCKKRLRQDVKRREANNVISKTIKTLTKKINSSMKLDEKEALASTLYSKLDKAAKRNVIHKNKASRRKSRIMAAINKEKAEQANNQ